MIRPTASVLVLLFGLLATAAGAADPADAAVEKDGARNLRGLVNKIVSPLTNQLTPGAWGRKKPGVIDPKYQPTQTIGSDYNPTRPAPIDPKIDPKYNPTMPAPKDDPNYKPGTRGRNLRGLVNKMVSPLMSQTEPGLWVRKKPAPIDPLDDPTQTIGPDYNPTRPAPIDPKIDPKYNPTMPAPKDDPNYKPGTRNLRGLIGDVTVRKKPGITYNPTRPSPDYQPTLPAPGIIDPLDDPTRTTLDPIKYNPTRPRDIDKYNPTMPPMDDPQYNPTMPAPASF